MTGLILHPLRHKALSEGRLSVLRVPFREQPKCFYHFVHVLNSLGYPASDGFAWAGFDYRPDNPDPIYFRAPLAPGDYFVREAWRQGYSPTQWWSDGIVYKADAARALGMREYSGSKWNTARSMPEKFARYIVTLGDPVPGKLGEVTENDAVLEGFGILNTRPDYIYAPWDSNPLDEFGETWGKMYPKHADPGTWTWAYPATWRKKTC